MAYAAPDASHNGVGVVFLEDRVLRVIHLHALGVTVEKLEELGLAGLWVQLIDKRLPLKPQTQVRYVLTT